MAGSFFIYSDNIVLSVNTFVFLVKKNLDNLMKRVDNRNYSICEKIFTIGDVCIEGR